MKGQESLKAQLSHGNEKLLRQQVDAWARNDFDALLALYNDDMEYVDMPFADRPVRGKDAFRKHLQEQSAQFVPGTVRVNYVNVIANGVAVAGELLVEARFVGEGAPEGGADISWTVTLVDTIVGGKVSTEHAYFDPQAFAKALERTAD